jgi:integrase/recombinase XerD
MSTIKVVLRKKVNKDGTFPLAIRITKDRKTSFMHLGYHLKESEWSEDDQRVKSSYPNSRRLNNLILARLAEASDKALEIETQKKDVSTKAIKQKIKPKGGVTFAPQAKIYLERLYQSGNYNSYIAEKSRVKIFLKFIGGKDITKESKPTGKKDEIEIGLGDIAFSDISVGFLERFKIELIAKRKCNDRTIANYLMCIRSIFSQAIKDEVIESKYYPFGKGMMSIKQPKSSKIGISQDDVVRLETVELLDPTHDLARNLWLFAYYFAGMRISDVLRLKWTDFANGRLHYTMGKNNKSDSLTIPPKAKAILEKYIFDKRKPDDFVFPDLKVLEDTSDDYETKRRIAYAVNWHNKKLQKYVVPAAGVEGKVTMHIGRHTFATQAGDKIPLQMLQKLYRHSDVRTTIGYQANFIYKDADDALLAVVG